MFMFEVEGHLCKLEALRWCQDVCTVHPGYFTVPLSVTNVEGEQTSVESSLPILWPWDCLAMLWNNGALLQWISDSPEKAADHCEEYWKHCTHLSFFEQLQLHPSQFRSAVPLYWHCDGVKIYKAQKSIPMQAPAGKVHLPFSASWFCVF